MEGEGDVQNLFMRLPSSGAGGASAASNGLNFVDSGGLAVNVPTNDYYCPAHPAPSDDVPPHLEDGSNDRPLLEELGIDFVHLRVKASQLLQPWAHKSTVASDDADLAGPVFAAVALGAALLLTGRLQFRYIYGCGVCGCLAIFVLLNLMVQSRRKVDLAFVVSTLGYCLLPHVALALLSVVRLVFTPPIFVAFLTAAAFIVWETWAATEVRYLAESR